VKEEVGYLLKVVDLLEEKRFCKAYRWVMSLDNGEIGLRWMRVVGVECLIM